MSPTADEADRDSVLAALLEQLLSEARQGQMPALDRVVEQHPHLADELRELCATMLVAEDFGNSASWLDTPTEAAPPATSMGMPSRVGDYELLHEIGRGGMGVVYQARQISLGRSVAVKMISRGELATPADLARFRAEAEAAAKVCHPQIVPIYEVGEAAGQPFFSMKLIEGTTLARKLADGPLPSRAAAELLMPICRAIADAHRQGVLHRDLKPSNILIDDAGHAYVADFGLAKRFSATDDSLSVAGSLTQTGAILGTPGYMAPEQAAGGRGVVGPASDVYGLGAILYALLTARPPFQAPSAVDTVLLVLEQEPLPPRYLNPKVDADLEMIALKCLQKPPDLRYASADALADDLCAYLANEPVSARSSHFTQILTRAFRETHHAPVLENWGLLWLWHSLVVLILCLVTEAVHWSGVVQRWPYIALWSLGVGIWAWIFWELRRRAGPISFVERQIAHVWAGSTITSTLLYALEWLLDLPVLTLSPVLGLIAGSVFLVKAGILSGRFYMQSAALFLTGLVMAVLQRIPGWDFGLILYGVVLAACFAIPGWKYWRRRVDG